MRLARRTLFRLFVLFVALFFCGQVYRLHDVQTHVASSTTDLAKIAQVLSRLRTSGADARLIRKSGSLAGYNVAVVLIRNYGFHSVIFIVSVRPQQRKNS